MRRGARARGLLNGGLDKNEQVALPISAPNARCGCAPKAVAIRGQALGRSQGTYHSCGGSNAIPLEQLEEVRAPVGDASFCNPTGGDA